MIEHQKNGGRANAAATKTSQICFDHSKPGVRISPFEMVTKSWATMTEYGPAAQIVRGGQSHQPLQRRTMIPISPSADSAATKLNSRRITR